MNYAEVYIDIKTHEVSQSFDYIIPHNLSSSIKPGSVVSVTFGNRKETGYVTRIKSSSSVDPGNLKYINDVAGDLSIFETTRLKLIFWMSAYFIQSVSKIISFFLPPVHEKKLTLFLKNPDKFIKQVSALPTGKEGYHAGINKTLKSTREKHREKTGYPSCHKDLYSNSKLDQIKACMRNEMFRGFLLKNMSPAEKMEVLKELCRASLHFKKTSVILSPETDDVQEIYENLNREFKGRVCIYHSDKKQSEKISAWHDVFFNRIELIVGTRSAIFLPFHSPGILILDDIHSISYKEATISRYDTRNIALRIGKLFKIPVVFISNTPPVEMFYRFESSGELEIVDVNGKEERYTGFIERRVIDLKKIDRYREDIHITNELHRAIGKEVNEGNRVLVFLNRRGYSNFLVCKKCGSIPKCPKCNISYTFHK
ncbi:MAG: hypothetical protein FJW66_07685, partial [Actinobacteria bacterium]|nr:hypothetical protein [Actinomycetota bacterium]